jgi:hypothetical protein
MAGMELFVAYPPDFKQLDDYLNRERSAAELDDLERQFHDPNPAFAPSATEPIPMRSGAQAHFLDHWVGNPPTVGGAYWPYLNEVDVGGMLRCAFETSVKLLVTARKKLPGKQTKYHATVWMCSQEVPRAFLAARRVRQPGWYKPSKKAQEKLFRIAVIELDHVVQVVISTPQPLPDELGALHRDLDVAYPIPHYRLRTTFGRETRDCEWIQYAHPMAAPWPKVETDDVAYGIGPIPIEFQRTVPGSQRIDTLG